MIFLPTWGGLQACRPGVGEDTAPEPDYRLSGGLPFSP